MHGSSTSQRHRKSRHVRRSQRRQRLRRWILVGAVGLAICSLLAFQAFRTYRDWNQKQALAATRESLTKHDLTTALFQARRAVQINDQNIEACRLLADLCDVSQLSEALTWRERVVALEPGLMTNLTALVSTALQLGELGVAEQALKSIKLADQQTAVFHSLAGELAIAQDDPGLAESHLAEAAKIEPNNAQLQLKLASVRLQSESLEKVLAGHTALEKLRSDPNFEVVATRALIAHARRVQNRESAYQMAKALTCKPHAPLSDKLLFLKVLHEQNHPDFNQALVRIQQESIDYPASIAAVMVWMNAHGLAPEAVQWAKEIAPIEMQKQPVPPAYADSLLLVKDWTRLEEWVQEGNWEESEYVRLAFLARVLREKSAGMEADSAWREAKQAAQDHPDQLLNLARWATAWDWKLESEAAWQLIAQSDHNRKEAWLNLYQIFRDKRDAEAMFGPAKELYHLMPSNLEFANSYAFLSLLLSKDMESVYTLAKEDYMKASNSPPVLLTYAFSLHRQGQAGEAVKAFGALPDTQLQQPEHALYYGLFMAALGQKQSAKQYLDLAEANPKLLKEESDLLFNARKKL
jgi:hypothetical protein